ncbi:MAG TPA: hypothetical protein VMF09_08590 [Solirubrobacteraceae bacterium]|nr:hypothetical protein [Solirubrobacteraceae bacterium]
MTAATARARHSWAHSESDAARRLYGVRDQLLPRTFVDSRCGSPGLDVSYGGLVDGLKHVLPFIERTRTELVGGSSSRAHGAWRRNVSAWVVSEQRGPLVALGLYDSEVPVVSAPATVVAPMRIRYVVHVKQRGTPGDMLPRRDREKLRSGIRRFGWSLERDESSAGFDFFFDRMHVPTMVARHGDDEVHTESRDIARHALFERGALLFLRHEGERRAGLICRTDGATVSFRLAGVLDGDSRHYSDSLQLGLYSLALEWAAEQGAQYVELSGSRPFVSEGLYQFKRKFRPEILLPFNHFRSKRLVLMVRQDTPEVRDWLVANPIIAIDGRQELRVLFFFDEERPKREGIRWRCSGIAREEPVDLDRWLVGASIVQSRIV